MPSELASQTICQFGTYDCGPADSVVPSGGKGWGFEPDQPYPKRAFEYFGSSLSGEQICGAFWMRTLDESRRSTRNVLEGDGA